MLFALGLAGSGCGLAVVPIIALALGLNPSNSDDDTGDVAVLVALLALPALSHPSFLCWYWKEIGGKFTKYSTTAANAPAIKPVTRTPSSNGGKGGRSNLNPNASFGGESDDVGAPTPPPWTGSVGVRVARALCVRRVVGRVVRSVAVGKGGLKYGGGCGWCRGRACGAPGTMPMARKM